MVLKKHLNEIKKGIKGVAEEGKKRAYKTISFIGQKVENDESLTEKIKDVAGKVTKQGKEMHDIIQEQGGYCAALKRAGNAVIDSTKDPLKNIEKKYKSFKNQFFTDNELDYEKTKVVLRDRKKAICKFGKKTVDKLSELVSKETEAIKKDYRTFVPNRKERETKYAGIGIKYSGVLLREDFENCLNFHEKIKSKFPKELKIWNKMLEDIKISAVNNKEDLVEFYKQSSDIDMIDVIKKYL